MDVRDYLEAASGRKPVMDFLTACAAGITVVSGLLAVARLFF